MRRSILLPLILAVFVLPAIVRAQDPLNSLQSFLVNSSVSEVADAEFAKLPIDADQAVKAQQLLWEAHQSRVKQDRAEEWEAKSITIGNKTMKFDYRVFGEKPEKGHSLFISMHGGGGAPARVNEQQWRNQIGLYEPEEGIYLAPRAPTDTWNLWHESHIDPMFSRIIENAIAIEGVDPNRVYIMGYSAGGDGVYQLAPRMADQVAAAAMMAGHPNGANPRGLRNIGFTLHMGGKDGAYKRNEIARKWKKRLAELKEEDPEGFEHEVVIHEEHGHWMQRDDAVAVPWMSKFTRNITPEKIIWVQSGVTHDRFYWLAVNEENKKGGTLIEAERDGQNFKITKATGLDSVVLRFRKGMIDFDQPVLVTFDGKEVFRGKVERSIAVLAKTLADRGDPEATFSGEIQVDLKGE
jgi:hypothetical protein